MEDSRSIFTHDDFDGVVSASLVSYAFGIDRIFFTGPNTISRMTIGPDDIVCDLPYPLECGLWFDHHLGNFKTLELRGIEHSDIGGKFEACDSCARVIWNYFKEEMDFPEYLGQTVDETDVIDGFKYNSVEDWRRETPGRIIANSMLVPSENRRAQNNFYRELVFAIRDMPLSDVVNLEEVQDRYAQFKEKEEGILRLIGDGAYFMTEDEEKELLVVDMSHHKRRLFIIKNMAYVLYPNAKALLMIDSKFEQGKKTNNLSLSMSLGFHFVGKEHGKDIGEIMRTLDLGDGHPGAAGGTIFADSKKEMMGLKEDTLKKIFKFWKQQ
jgi:oligoribonuclease NrnB/cAMP/cGMP phosphodiesterase (DHH superfamily)